MRELSINLDELITEATWGHDPDFSPMSALDIQTGELIVISREVWNEIESEGILSEPLDEEQLVAQKVIQDYDTDEARYRTIPELDGDEAYRFMDDFAHGHVEGDAKFSLLRALEKRKPFRHFKNALLDFPEVREQWFTYEAERHREWILRWLETLSIAPVSVTNSENRHI